MFSREFDFFLAGAALIIGIMMLTGHGDFFLKGGNADLRKKKYDEAKLSKASGVTLILIGIATGIDSYTTSLAAKIAYVVILLAILAGLGLFLKFKCQKQKEIPGFSGAQNIQ